MTNELKEIKDDIKLIKSVVDALTMALIQHSEQIVRTNESIKELIGIVKNG